MFICKLRVTNSNKDKKKKKLMILTIIKLYIINNGNL